MKQYNILWADDEVNVLLSESTIKSLAEKNIYVIGTARSGKELEQLIEEMDGRFFAVVVDANFNVNGPERNSKKGERDLSGLRKAFEIERSLIKKGNHCPFLIYTGRNSDILNEELCDNELDFYVENDRIFYKTKIGDFNDLKERIIELVDEVNSPEYQIRCRYSRELRIAQTIKKGEQRLMEGLMFEYKESKNTQDYFKSIRGIIEQMVSRLQELGYLPNASLNSIPKLLLHDHTAEERENYAIKRSIMPKALAYAFSYVMAITQDGAHEKYDLNLKVFEYVVKRQNSNLYRSMLFITLDLLLWYEECLQTAPDPDNILRKYEKTGEVVVLVDKRGREHYYVGEYELENTKDSILKEKLYVGIEKSIPHVRPVNNVTKYVRSRDYRIIPIDESEETIEDISYDLLIM